MKIIKFNKSYKTASGMQTIFSNACFDLGEWDSVAICGRSGSGKTTLLSILSGLDINYEGEYTHADVLMKKNRHDMSLFRYDNIGMITQDFKLLEDRNVYDNLVFSIRNSNIDKKEIGNKVKEILNIFNLSHLERKYPKALSGGEQQRIAICRALIRQPKYIFADEPTSELDEETEYEVLKIFERYKKSGVTFIIATHSENVANFCKTNFYIKDKKIIHDLNPL